MESYTSCLSTYVATQVTAKPDDIYVVYSGRTSSKQVCHLCSLNRTVRYFVLQGMPYSPVRFIEAPDAQCLQGMLYSPVKFIEAPDAQCLQGMPYSPVKFTGAQMPNVCRGYCIPR